MFQTNHDNLPRKRKKQQEQAMKNSVLDASAATAENAITMADLMDLTANLATQVAELKAAQETK